MPKRFVDAMYSITEFRRAIFEPFTEAPSFLLVENAGKKLSDIKIWIKTDHSSQNYGPPNLLFPLRKMYPYSELFWSAFFSYFPAFGLNTKRYGVSLRIQSKCKKMRTRIIPNTDTFYAVANEKQMMIVHMFRLVK